MIGAVITAVIVLIFGLFMAVGCAMEGGWNWLGALWGVALVISATSVIAEESGTSHFETEMTRIGDELRRAQRVIDRLEAEATQAINDEAARQQLRSSRTSEIDQ